MIRNLVAERERCDIARGMRLNEICVRSALPPQYAGVPSVNIILYNSAGDRRVTPSITKITVVGKILVVFALQC